MQVAARSDGGAVRDVNEDYVLVDSALGLVVVADGAGGLITGVLAARLAAEGLREHLRSDPSRRTDEALKTIDRIVFEAAQSEGKSLSQALVDRLDGDGMQVLEMARAGRGTLHGMHATMVVAMIHEDAISLAHVGHCRGYRITRDAALALTADHTVPGLPTITMRVVGAGNVESEIQTVRLLDGERLLLCSDGLHRALDNATIAKLASEGSVELAVDALIERARQARAADNVAVALLQREGGPLVSCRNGSAWGR